MEENQVSLRGTGIKYGLITAAIFIAYFLVMHGAGLINYTALRLFNYAFLAVGIYLALGEVTRRTHKHRVDYLQGLGLGFVVVMLTSMLFSIFVFVYAQFIDPSFLAVVRPNLAYYNGDLNGYILGVFIFGESLMFGVILNFMVMQFFKRNRASDREAQEEADEHKHSTL